jgi:hypothetical protein
MLATELLFVSAYCLVDDEVKASVLSMELARHGAHTFEGLLTRTVAILAAHTLLLTLPAEAN